MVADAISTRSGRTWAESVDQKESSANQVVSDVTTRYVDKTREGDGTLDAVGIQLSIRPSDARLHGSYAMHCICMHGIPAAVQNLSSLEVHNELT